MLRELLFIIRLWGRTNEGILPSYTKTAESFDVLAKLFSLITRLKESPTSNDAIIEECIQLPSQVMIPPLDIVIPARGLAYLLINRSAPISAHYQQEPDLDGNGSSGSGSNVSRHHDKFDEGGPLIPRQYMDSVRHIFLGKKPFIIKECSRCLGTSLPPTSDPNKNILNKGWDQRWTLKCPCGGPWKLTCMDAKGQRRNLLA